MTVAAAWSIALLLLPPGGHDVPPYSVAAHVRGASAFVQSLLDGASATSPTVRQLVDRLAATDAIVYVELNPVPPGMQARTRLVTATAGARYLRIALNSLAAWADLAPLIAHELQHAVEIAEHADVRDEPAVRRLYTAIGRANGRDSFETEAAGDVERRVRLELRGGGAVREPPLPTA